MSVSVPHENVGLSISMFMPGFVDADPDCGLLDTLIAFWFGNRSGGIADDVHTNNLDLTDVATVTSAAGHVYPLARQYTAANLEYHTRAGDDALLSTGDVDFTLATWVYADAFTLAGHNIVSKWGAAGNREHLITYEAASNRYFFRITNDGTTIASVAANNYGAPPTTTWTFIVCWHDSVANTINIQIDNGAVDSIAHTTGVFDSTAKFRIGFRDDAVVWYWDGRIGPTMFWKSAAGGGGVLTSDQRDCLWNAGSGLQYGELT